VVAAECDVAAVVIVGVQPVGEFFVAFAIAAVEPRVGLFVGQRAVKSLNLAVGLGPVGPCAPVFDSTE
jgi:hypothetical protein